MTAVSIVVATYNRWDRLQLVLRALAAQTASSQDYEVIVVSDGSTDGTNERLEAGDSPMPVRFITQENQGPAAARNAGIAVARSELVLFIDDDVVAGPECVAAHLEAHERADGPTVVIGPLLTPEGVHLSPYVQWEQAMLYKQYDAINHGDWAPTARQFYTGNASLRRDLLNAVGGFDESLRRAEDVELAYRLSDIGVHFDFAFTARAFHHAERSYESWLANAQEYGRNDVVFWRDGDQDWLLPRLRADYLYRNPLIRLFTRACLAIPKASELAYRAAPRWVALVERTGTDEPGRRVLSAVYNLAYYEALIDEIGGMRAFLAIEPAA